MKCHFLVLFFVWVSASVAADTELNDCGSSLKRALIESMPESSGAREIILSSASERWRRSPDPGWQKIVNSVSESTGWLIEIKTDGVKFYGQSEISGDVLKIHIRGFSSGKGKTESGQTVYWQYGERPERLHAGFVHMMGSLIAGIEKAIEKNPQVRNVEIKGAYVVNPHLRELLKSWGFKASPGPWIAFKKLVGAMTGTFSTVAAATGDTHQIPSMVNMGVLAKAMAAFTIENRDWILRLHLPPKLQKSGAIVPNVTD